MPQKLLEQLASPENLLAAWRAVRGNVPRQRRNRSFGPDNISMADFECDLPAQLAALQDMLLKGRYQPSRAAKFNLPKRTGGHRVIYVLTIRDRVAQRAAQQVLEPLWEPYFLPCSYGFRPGLSVEDAAGHLVHYLDEGNLWVVDGDIQSCFDTIDHDLMMKLLRRKVHDPHVLYLISAWLDIGVLEAGLPDKNEYSESGTILNKSIIQQGIDWAFKLAAEELDVSLDEAIEPGSGGLISNISPGYSDERTGMDDYSLQMRRRALRKLASTGIALGASWAAPNIASFGKRAATHLNSPSARRVIKKGAWLSGGLAAGAAIAATSAFLLKRKAGPTPTGVLQGSPLSPLLANIYLHSFDEEMIRRNHKLVRYADDWVICCPLQETAEQAFNDALTALARLHLKINPEKTRILAPGEKLEWLGMHIR